MRVAICYWGMTRSTRLVYHTHEKYLFDILKTNDIEYNTYIHTWKTDYNVVWDEALNIPNDYEEWRLLKPTEYCLDNQDVFLNSINFNDYYDATSKDEWNPRLIINHLCALESKRRVFQMAQKNPADFVIFIRPDVEPKTYFNIVVFNMLQEGHIAIPHDNHGEGYNDRFAVVPMTSAAPYAERINEIAEFRRTQGRIVSEKYVKFIIDKYYKVHFFKFKFIIIRPYGLPAHFELTS
jgi:hypothetical protein